MEDFNSFDPEDISLLISIIATALSKNKSIEELTVIGNFMISVGEIIITISSEKANLLAKQTKKMK
ncbi:hypothetical protein [Clostridium pasteurianum]|uniref:Uncharacterized protein n=1 Tax=Clostridium pasteurianum BC1 TaxID=86416 RepID=R4K6B1_CLOPA|nr:hypothetical protein [Clostridium pasteurianum]AGK97251.1 hypothetical protein Clopa_2388 [Clostridium pasteurianum BC1]